MTPRSVVRTLVLDREVKHSVRYTDPDRAGLLSLGTVYVPRDILREISPNDPVPARLTVTIEVA